MNKFKVGDEVIIKPGVSRYAITAPGSEGTIVDVFNQYIDVSFHKVTGAPQDLGVYSIDKDCLEINRIFGTPLYEALK